MGVSVTGVTKAISANPYNEAQITFKGGSNEPFSRRGNVVATHGFYKDGTGHFGSGCVTGVDDEIATKGEFTYAKYGIPTNADYNP